MKVDNALLCFHVSLSYYSSEGRIEKLQFIFFISKNVLASRLDVYISREIAAFSFLYLFVIYDFFSLAREYSLFSLFFTRNIFVAAA